MKYKYVKLSKREYLLNIFVIVLVLFVVAKLFYGTFLAGFVLLPLEILIFKQRKEKICRDKLEKLESEFKDFLVSVSDSMSTGYSVENAIKESYKDMLSVYGYNSAICRELRLMISGINLNVNVETVIEEFAQRADTKNIRTFSRIFSTAKRTGGNMTEIIKSVTDDIVMKESVKEEINVMMNSKKTEQRIMTAIPLLLIVYMNIASPGFLDPMYETWAGRIVMTVCIVCYGAAYMWSEKITNVEV